MPHGSITPLGRQLRSVLAALRPAASESLYPSLPFSSFWRKASTWKAACSLDRRPAHCCNEERQRQWQRQPQRYARCNSRLAASFTPVDASNHCRSDLLSAQDIPKHRRVKEPRHFEDLSQELRKLGRHDVAPERHFKKASLAYVNARSRHGWRALNENRKRLAAGGHPDYATMPKLLRILSSYVRRVTRNTDSQQAALSSTYKLSDRNAAFLSERGYSIEDLKVWAAIVMEPDSFEASSAIQARVASHGVRAVPVSVLFYLLLRPYISARALHVLLPTVWSHVAELQVESSKSVSVDTVFTVFVRLVRHAREVWPQSLEFITENMLRYMPGAAPELPLDNPETLQRTTFLLNKAMYLISEPTAVTPFKDNPHQEAAIVRILAFMANTTPTLQLDRTGYRAVVRIQLAQKKTRVERHWAELKALSWPPWKEDRTSMDSEIQPEHGISKAGDTLRRMKEAGYAPGSWERIAALYAGWDTDSTPTIQTRTVLPTHFDSSDYQAAVWEARIKTTRTVQEAWACYLAYEDTKLPPHQGILLAILEKLRSEEVRQQQAEKPTIREFEAKRQPHNRLLPGDSREISPLPPSTHLYTYTRTAPPSVHEFFAELRKNDIKLNSRCLGFMLANANTFQAGLEYMRNSQQHYPVIADLLVLDSNADVGEIPLAIMNGFIVFLTRFPNDSVRRPHEIKRTHLSVLTKSHGVEIEKLNLGHGLIRAIILLETQKPHSLIPWNTVLQALSNDYALGKIQLAGHSSTKPTEWERPDQSSNSIVAYRLMQQVLDLLLSQHMDLDTVGFLAICRGTEKVAIASWKILLQDAPEIETTFGTLKKPATVTDAKELLTRQKPHWRLEQYFKLLVGQQSYLDPARKLGGSHTQSVEPVSGLPRLLANPGPAVLHAYIRALGWCGAHERLLDTVKWMVEYRAELTESRAKDRNGEAMMRRAIVALRVFLERSWMEDATEFCKEQPAAGSGNKSLALRRLEAVAAPDLVEEARELVDGVEEWGGWPEDEEVEDYCVDDSFEQFR